MGIKIGSLSYCWHQIWKLLTFWNNLCYWCFAVWACFVPSQQFLSSLSFCWEKISAADWWLTETILKRGKSFSKIVFVSVCFNINKKFKSKLKLTSMTPKWSFLENELYIQNFGFSNHYKRSILVKIKIMLDIISCWDDPPLQWWLAKMTRMAKNGVSYFPFLTTHGCISLTIPALAYYINHLDSKSCQRGEEGVSYFS